jgi:hypothetical protein
MTTAPLRADVERIETAMVKAFRSLPVEIYRNHNTGDFMVDGADWDLNLTELARDLERELSC